MKNKYIKIALLLVGITFTSCNDFLDENPDKRTQVDSKEKIAKILVSAYSTASPAVLTELSSDNIDDLGSNVHWSNDDLSMFYWKDVDEEGLDTPQHVWSGLYSAIANANAALDAIQKSENPQDLLAEKGEALVARAYAHFILVNVFGRHYNTQTSETDLGVVYMEKSEKTLDPKYKRETVAENYRKIEKDLLEGLPLIQDELYKQPKYHLNKKAAEAFAARFYLFYGKWAEAEKYANDVLGANPSSILKNYKELSSGIYEKYQEVPRQYVSPERVSNLMVADMYSLRSRKFYWGGDKNVRFHHHTLLAQTETVFTNSFYGRGGQNFYLSIFTAISPINNTVFHNIPEFFEYSDPVAGIGSPHTGEVLFSTDEVLLIRAEARIMQKKYDEAASDLNLWAKNFCVTTSEITKESINEFYNGINYYTDDAPTQKKHLNPKFELENGMQENMIHAVLQCRRVLTLYHGMRWFDIKRYGIEITRRVLGNDGTSLVEVKDRLLKDDPRRAIQLPENVIKAGLEANPR
ncbi:RagB/SusD family nutrient uptake outer membrane protein [Ornithobacterium rhinotracheale]|uniref:RagB/SusD family nutrient uptake outer membrane protein n=1 Tax=Ornithobacterium rhinotracheale TaxID=28251 RepID=UPI001FF1572D|nr:RagB/SusD family nutrient uptake outer membrane protein [Ornithobacterium rhinotracheale]MCK0204518.1 RagB/SusD family nutrient uptake outer membrane protein [Ornithobacterium rhinotracheale]